MRGILFWTMTPITLRKLRKTFGKTVAVDGIDLDIPAGALFFLLGPSGCGKTTLLRMIAGFTDPTSGTLHFGTRDVTHLSANKRNCGMVFQGYALWPHMTVRENVAFGLDVRKVKGEARDKRVDDALESVHMGPYADRKPNELSGGQQQRVALARALVVKPTVLLLDEPLSNLDAKLRIEMRSEIKRICKDAGITGVYVTHDQKEALSMADGVAVLKDGKLMQVGDPRELYHRPRSRFVADFLGETNFIQAHVVRHDADGVLLECPAGPLRSSVRADHVPNIGSVVCSVRPEAIRVTRDADRPVGLPPPPLEQVNRLPARRTDMVYLGEVAQHHLMVGDDTPIKAFELNPRVLSSNGQGDPEGGGDDVMLEFDSQDVVILRD